MEKTIFGIESEIWDLNTPKGATKAMGLRAKDRFNRGICNDCNNLKMPTSSFCEKHWYHHQAANVFKGYSGPQAPHAQELKDLLIKQNYRCAYTGRLLTPGLNASVDHIKPFKRFPELAANITNMEWVDLPVNYMKRALTKEEFLATCQQILDYTGGK